MGKILNSKFICGNIENTIRAQLKDFPNISLASVGIGVDYSAQSYRSSQEKVAASLGLKYRLVDFEKDVSFSEFKGEINKLNSDKSITGIVINKPFGKDWEDEEVFSLIDKKKDVEGMHPFNVGKFFINSSRYQIDYKNINCSSGNPVCLSPTFRSIIALLFESGVDIRGKKTTIVGFSSLIGKPLALFLADELSTVTITHIATFEKGELPQYVRSADILISAVGIPNLIKGDWIKDGAIVIDVGIGEVNGKVVGDVEFEAAKDKASFITPVPGGVGKLTTMFLYDNLCILARNQ